MFWIFLASLAVCRGDIARLCQLWGEDTVDKPAFALIILL